MPKCMVLNIEYPKNKTFEVCVNGEKFAGETDVEIDLKEQFICALENAVVETMVPDSSKAVKLGEVYKIPKREQRFRVIRLEKKHTEPEVSPPSGVAYEKLEEGVPPKPRGNPNWRKKHTEPEFNTIANNTMIDGVVI